RAVATEIQVLKSQPVRAAVLSKLGSAPHLSASPVGQTDVIEVRAQSTRPSRAADITNAYANAYIDFRRKQAVDDLLAAGQEVQSKIDDLGRQILEAKPGPERDALVTRQCVYKQRRDQLLVAA